MQNERARVHVYQTLVNEKINRRYTKQHVNACTFMHIFSKNQIDCTISMYLTLLTRWETTLSLFFTALHINCISKDLSFNSTLGNPTYTHSSLSRQKILQNYQSVFTIFNIPNKQNEFDLPYLYWIPKLHKDPYKHRYIAVSTTCFTKASFFTPYLNFYSCEGETSSELYSNTRIKKNQNIQSYPTLLRIGDRLAIN